MFGIPIRSVGYHRAVADGCEACRPIAAENGFAPTRYRAVVLTPSHCDLAFVSAY